MIVDAEGRLWYMGSHNGCLSVLESGYEQMLPLNIEGMYQHVQMHRRGN